MFYEWNDNLSVGVPSIDRQHKVLISLINDLHSAINTGKGQSDAKLILKKIITYARAHFIYEESLFTSKNYSETEEHLASHENIKATLLELQTKAEDDKFNLPDELMDFLKSWLNNHILKEDMGYSELLIKNKIQ
jgi:hemerythrin